MIFYSIGVSIVSSAQLPFSGKSHLVMISLEQKLIASLSSSDEINFKDDQFGYEAIFLSNIIPDETNARYLPAIMISDDDAALFVNRRISKRELVKIYDGEGQVLIGKDCVINCLEHGSLEWKKANETITSVIDLANNLIMSEIIQVPTIYMIDNGRYQILTGHRRYFALVYANGIGSVAQFKVYRHEPLLLKTKQFQENASREDLPQYGKLLSFNAALIELESVSNARLKRGFKKLTVRETVSILGISMGAFDNYNVLTRYPCVLKAYENGLSMPFLKAKKIVLAIENDYKARVDKSTLNVTDRRQINSEIEEALTGSVKKNGAAPPYKFKPVSSPQTIKTLFQKDIFQLDTGIDWEQLDWDSKAEVNKALAAVIDFLENQASDFGA